MLAADVVAPHVDEHDVSAGHGKQRRLLFKRRVVLAALTPIGALRAAGRDASAPGATRAIAALEAVASAA